MTLLAADHVSKRFGGLTAVDELSLSVPEGEIVALIGPNGAGKTTCFNCLTGLLRPESGQIRLDGHDMTSWSTHRRARAGLGRTFQRLEVFTRMTVYENLQVAAEAASPGKVFSGIFRLRHRTEPAIAEQVEATLAELGIEWASRVPAGDLPTGILRLVELGRALCARPRVLLLDEPASGLDADETEHFRDVLESLAQRGIGILLIEHDIQLVMAVARHVTVMDFGRVIATGSPAEVAADPAVQAAYLGEPAEAAS